MSNDAFRQGVQDELDKKPFPVMISLGNKEYCQEYKSGRNFVKILRETNK